MLTGKNNEEKIWKYLKAAGLNDCGIAGLMGNLYAESGLMPNNVQNCCEKKLGVTDASYTAAVDSGAYTNFAKDAAGYGIAQWTYWSRKQGLLDFAKAQGKSIGDLEMQLDFLMKELREGYKTVLTILRTAGSVRAASDAVLLKFERPADQSVTVQVKRAAFGQRYYDKFVRGGSVGTTNGGGKMTARELAEKASDIAKNRNTVYMWGVFGAPVTESVIAGKAKQYPSWYSAAKQADFRKLIGKGYFGFDCVCLIKAILWGWNGDSSKSYGGAVYASNGVPDIGADSMIAKCSGVSATGWDSMEVGEALWCSGHIGIYIGGGLAVECTPAWENRVQITAVKNIGTKAGYNARRWTKHGKLPYVTYDGKAERPGTAQPSALGVIAVGERVTMDKAATVYGTMRKFSSWVYGAKLYVREIDGSRVVVSTLKSGAVTGAVDKKYLTKV